MAEMVKRHRGSSLPAVLALLALGLFPAPATAAGDKPAMTVILDSSRSMWGQIEGINKVVSTRTVISQLASAYASKLDLGLVAYGHRQSAGCRDVEVILPPASRTAAAVAKTVNSIKPKGSTPIALALKTAAEAARTGEDKESTLLLISDGLDNCNGDPCAVAEALKKKSAGLAIHVVAFGRGDQKELAKLSCIAENTGATFAHATKERDLLAAVMRIADAVTAPRLPKVVQKPAAPAPEPALPPRMQPPQTPPPLPSRAVEQPVAPPSEAVQQPDKPAPPAKTAKADKGQTPAAPAPDASVPVSFTAQLTEGGPNLKSGVVWRIYEANPNKQGKYKLVATHRTPTATDALRPGEYLVNAAYGLAHITRRIQVQAGRSLQENFILNAGGLRLGAVLTNGESIPPNSVRYDIFADEADQFGNRKKILGDAKPGLVIRLNAGAYHIVSVYGDANAVVRADVAVEAGRLTEATFNHSAAKVTFKLVLQPGGEALADTQWNILTPSGDVIKESAGALPTHVLAAGTYSVLARHDGKNYTRDFEVKSGEVKQIEVVVR